MLAKTRSIFEIDSDLLLWLRTEPMFAEPPSLGCIVGKDVDEVLEPGAEAFFRVPPRLESRWGCSSECPKPVSRDVSLVALSNPDVKST
jgi:hypothetical protein